MPDQIGMGIYWPVDLKLFAPRDPFICKINFTIFSGITKLFKYLSLYVRVFTGPKELLFILIKVQAAV